VAKKKKSLSRAKHTGKNKAVPSKKNGIAKLSQDHGQVVAVPIVHAFRRDLATVFANHFVVQHDNSVFRLMFFEVHPPLILGDEEDKKKAIEQLKSIEARCVARIIIPAEQMPKVVEALVSNIQKQSERATEISAISGAIAAIEHTQ